MTLRRSALWAAVVSVCVVGFAWADDLEPQVRYDGYRVVRVFAESWEQIEAVEGLGLQLMSEAVGIGPVDYLVPPEAMAGLASLDVMYKVINDDIQKDIDRERALMDMEPRVDSRDPAWFQNYKTFDQVNAKLNQMVTDRPDLVSLLDLGTSIQGRHIYGIRIGSAGEGKPAILFDGCHHAREWISVMVPMWIADKLVYEYNTNPDIQYVVDNADIYVVPVVNPDGFVYTQTQRLWRKNRRPPPSGSTCYGVDINRNYGTGWGGGGSSSNPCDETYRGTAAFSEPETVAMRNFTQAHPQIVVAQSYHSYAQLIMSPYGYTSTLPPDNAILVEMDKVQHDLALAVHGVQYDYGPIYSTIYQASGGATDWQYAVEGIFAFTTELRDTGTYGFELPANQIIPNCEEMWPGAMYLIGWAATPVKISFPNGHPSRLAPETAETLRVHIFTVGSILDPNSPTLYARAGGSGPFTEYPLTALGGGNYDATLPATHCGQTLHYYVSAATTTGTVGYSPGNAPSTDYQVTATPIVTVLSANMDTNPAWTISGGQWAWGHPTGGGSNNHDPTNGHSGSNVYGYNLSGDYPNSMPVYYLTTPTINCAGITGAHLEFWRWLGVESNSNYDKATVDISVNNGSTWVSMWRAVDTGGAVADTAWVFQSFDLSDWGADNKPQVKLRWSMGPTDGGVTYPGWNIDDVVVWAPDPAGCPPANGACCHPDGSCTTTTQAGCTGTYQGDYTACTPNPCAPPVGACCQADGSCLLSTQAECSGTYQGDLTTCDPNPCVPPVCRGDCNCDHAVGFLDIDLFVAAIPNNQANWAAKYQQFYGQPAPAWCWENTDVNGVGTHAGFDDIDPFVALIPSACP